MLAERRKSLVFIIFALFACLFATACAQSQTGESGTDEQVASAQSTTKGVNFAGNKAPAASYFGKREFEQPIYDASKLRDEYVTDVDPGSYTLMIYLDGADLEDPNGGSCPASATIEALSHLNIDADKVKIVVFTGGSKSWGLEGLEGSGNYIISYEASPDGEGLTTIRYGDAGTKMNMGDPATLTAFLDTAVDKFPADHYALVFWDHGGGPLGGCESDENYQGDMLTLKELDEAFGKSPFGKGEKLDWIGFDCCLMASVELAEVLDDYAYYMVASQESETGLTLSTAEQVERYGSAWVYDFINVLNDTSSPVKVTTSAIDRFADGQENIIRDWQDEFLREGGGHVEYTQSLIDLGKTDNVSSAMNELFSAMKRDLARGSFSEQARIRSYVKEYAEGSESINDLVDLGYLAWAYEELYPAEAGLLEEAIGELVLYQRTNVAEATGVSLYFPFSDGQLYASVYEGLNTCSGYEEYLEEFTDMLANGDDNVSPVPDGQDETVDTSSGASSASASSAETEDNGSLSPERPDGDNNQDDASGDGASIEDPIDSSDLSNSQESESAGGTGSDSDFGNPSDEGSEYESAQQDEYAIQLTEDQQKALSHVSYNVLKKGSDDDKWSGGNGMYSMLLQDCQVAADGKGVVHIAKNQALLALVGEGGRQVTWPFKQVSCGVQTAKYQSLATTLDGPFGAAAWTDSIPATIKVTEKLGLGGLNISAITYRDDSNKVYGKADADMDKYDYLYNWVQPCRPADDADMPAWEWETWDGAVASGLAIDSMPEVDVVTTSELQGDYVAQVIITDVQGRKKALGLYELDSAPKPKEETESIGGFTCTFDVYDDHAVIVSADGDGKEFAVPDECEGKPVTEIGDGAFRDCDVKSVSVPGSVKVIGFGAFANTLEEAVLSDGVEKLSAGAFSGCKALTDIALPQSLTSIGDGAFRGCENLGSLEIPSGVTYIGDGAFEECSRLKGLTVAQGSLSFKVEESEDGNVLFTADGTELVACPGLFHSSYTVPEGTVRIRDRAFNGSYSESIGGSGQGDGHSVVGYGLAQVKFPGTLKEIGDAAFFRCNRLEDIDLPAGLEIIGMEAFGSTDLTGTIGLGSVRLKRDVIDEVVIGKNVRWIGQGAFNSFEVKEFVVEKGNWYFTTKNGKLMTRDGKREIDVYGD